MASDIRFIGSGNNAGYYYCVFKVPGGKYWEYPTNWPDRHAKVIELAKGKWVTGRDGKKTLIPPQTGKALNLAKKLAAGKEFDVTERETARLEEISQEHERKKNWNAPPQQPPDTSTPSSAIKLSNWLTRFQNLQRLPSSR